MKNKIIAVDFDGTLCVNKCPEIGDPNEELIAYLKKRQANGEKLILWTNRVDDRLDEAVKWCAEHGLVFDAVNDNLPEIVESFGRYLQMNTLMIATGCWSPVVRSPIWNCGLKMK